MLGLLTGIWGRVAATGGAVIGAVAAIGAVWAAGRRDGAMGQRARDSERTEAARGVAEAAADRVARTDADTLRDELRRDYTRRP